MKAIVNTSIYDFEQYIEEAYVLFDSKIIKAGPMSEFVNEGYEIIDGRDHLVMPSLVNGHTHIYSTFARGLAMPFNPGNFVELLEQMWWKLDSRLELEDVYHSGVVYSRDALLNGVTTVIDHHAGRAVRGSLNQLKKAVIEEAGMRGIFCFETSDRFDLYYCINENMDFAKANKAHNCRGLFGMHASMTLSEESLKMIKEAIDEVPIHIHVAESKYDESECMLKYGKKIIERLNDHGLLTENSLLAHCLYIDNKEADLIAEKGCKVVYNVTSNMNNSVGLPDYRILEKRDVSVLIGNDGIATGITTEWLNMLYSMHLRFQTPSTFGMDRVRQMIDDTYSYTSQLLGVKLGRVKVGYESDLLMIPYIPPTPMNSSNGFGHLFYGLANSFRPRHVWCGGKQLVTDFEVDSAHVTRYRGARKVSSELWERLK